MHPFLGRTIQVVRDLSVDEQLYLYEKSRAVKEAILSGGDISEFRITNPDLGVYLFFLEDSTRTKESFRNAAKFHELKLNDFSAAGSSFKKKESITDTVKMLFGYSTQSIFVVRSKIEGLCRWLEVALSEYASLAGLPVPSFINGGDGRHEHPTQELLDEFSFLEHAGWDRSHIHLALVGDLFHGRTVHTKPEGLRIFREVEVDLVAPEELRMPPYYLNEMEDAGFSIRLFESIDEYLSQSHVAPSWYFTRLQLERMGERLLEMAETLRQAVTFRRDHLDRVGEGTRFFHPLPRHQITPVIPTFLDSTPLNGWDRQSMNGYFTRIVEIAMVGGRLGEDFVGIGRETPEFADDFVEEVAVRPKRKPDYKIGIKPVENGIVVDHIGRGKDPETIWNHIDQIRRILGFNCISSHGVYTSTRSREHKGIVSLPESEPLDERTIKMLGAIAPGCTLNVVEGGRVRRKYRLHMPPRVYNMPAISCKNEACVSNPDHHEPVSPEFYRHASEIFICRYCERPHVFGDIW